jgi:hypothetical protein
MTISYVNDLRLSEMATGDNSGTWGNVTNTNLELVGEALGYGTQQVFASDADATTTVLDGASDPARAMYFKVTSGASLSATRTMTIAPNTISRVMFIENTTTGSQDISVKQGSGAQVTIPNGAVKMVYLDGAGSGAAVTDGLIDLNMGGSLTVGGDLTVNSDTITFTSANSSDPILKLINTTNDTNGAEIHLRKDKGAAGADGDIVGLISFIGDDATQVQHIFAKMEASIATAADGSEGGKLILGVATHDAEFQNGLVLQDGSAEDEIDVTIASGSSSVTTVAGVLISNNNFEVKTGGPSTYDGITDDGAGIVVGSSSSSVSGLAIRTGTSGVGSIYFADNSGSADARKAGFIEFQHATDDMIIQAEDDLRLYAKEDMVMRGVTYTFDSEGGTAQFAKIDTSGNLALTTDGVVLSFGASEEVTLTHVHNNGLQFNSSYALYFRDVALSINSSTDGQLDIVADAEIEITAPIVDVDGQLYLIRGDGESDNEYVATFKNEEATDDRSYGVLIHAGSTTTDRALTINDHDGSNALFYVGGAGDVSIGTSVTPPVGLTITRDADYEGVNLTRLGSSGNPSDNEELGSYAWNSNAEASNNLNTAEAKIVARAAEAHSGSAAGTDMEFYNKNNGTGPGSAGVKRLHLHRNGRNYIATDTQSGEAHNYLVSNRVSIAGSASKTHTFSSLVQGYCKIKIGYSDGNAQYAHFVVELGGQMWSGGNGYNATVVANDASTASISVTKNNASYVVTVNAGSNYLYGAVEVSGASFTGEAGVTYAFS